MKYPKLKMFFAKNSPLILCITAVLGVGTTGVLAARGGMKAASKIKDDMTKAEKIRATWKDFAPAVGVGVATAASMVGSHTLSAKQIAGLTAAAGYLAANRDKISQLSGIKPQEALDIHEKDGNITLYDRPIGIEETGYGNLLCFDGYSGRWFRSSKEEVEAGIQRLNDRFESGCGEYLSLNDFYREMHIAETQFGWQYGWAANIEYYDAPIDIETCYVCKWEDWLNSDCMTIREPVLLLDFHTYPMECWMEV